MKSSLEITLINEKIQKPLVTKEQISFWLHRYRKTDVTKYEQRQRLIDSFVNAIYFYDDKVILTFNYKDVSKTITLADVECSDLGACGAPSAHNPNHSRQVVPIGEGFGFVVYFNYSNFNKKK